MPKTPARFSISLVLWLFLLVIGAFVKGFSNYLLDQTVIRDVQDPNTHATVWNRAAEFWQKANPDRIEEVPTSQYIKGEDF